MIIRVVAAVLALVLSVHGACVCPSNINKYSQTYQIATPFDPDQGYADCVPDAMYCTYTIQTGNGSVGLGNFGVQSFVDPSRVLAVTLQDGSFNNFTLTVDNFKQMNATLNVYPPITATTTVHMTWTAKVTTASATIYGYPKVVSQPVVTTTATPMPTPVTVSGAPSPAKLLGLDLAIVLDTYSVDPLVFTTMKNVITSAVSKLTVFTDYAVPYGVRLVLQTMAQTNRPNNFGDPWHIDFDYFVEQIAVFRPSGTQSVWQGPLSAGLDDDNAFFKTGVLESSSRDNVQRTYAIFTQGAPSDIDKIGDFIAKLKDVDVHMVVFDFGSSPDSKLQQFTTTYKNFDYIAYNPDSPDDFFQKYLLTNDASKNFGCSNANGGSENKVIPADGSLSYQWPPLYTPGTARYCNNQASTLLLQAAGKKAICITITEPYELEPEKDYVRFFDGSGNLRASLTGMGIAGSKFQLKGATATVTFTTNEYNVFHGIKFTAASTDEDNCPSA
ncbi:unnamed protein product, partial [Mesorhabditis spiculigera]